MAVRWSDINRERGFGSSPGEPDEDDQGPGEAPETPLDEPGPPRVQDPPPHPGQTGPYVVQYTVGNLTEGLAVTTTGERKERRGFASMSAEKQREIASKGGRAAHEKGTAHEWNADEARNAGRKGGQVSRGGRGRLIVPAETVEVSPVAEGAAENRAE
jgi:general stress protein YciG